MRDQLNFSIDLNLGNILQGMDNNFKYDEVNILEIF